MAGHTIFANRKIGKLGHSGKKFCNNKWQQLTNNINKFDGNYKYTPDELKKVTTIQIIVYFETFNFLIAFFL